MRQQNGYYLLRADDVSADVEERLEVGPSDNRRFQEPDYAAALEFAGNDVKIELGEDGHSNRHGASILPDTLRWLWHDYPQPICCGSD